MRQLARAEPVEQPPSIGVARWRRPGAEGLGDEVVLVPYREENQDVEVVAHVTGGGEGRWRSTED